ncbi:hypothetical protein [[Clostridium] innocuum]|uniref:hypothetical protein n=1 Tax=Clostridium innocuum TaxID=1522 RepID=UPI001E2B6D41|nr:hypothetical protein [[Clostridium] innocuum]DAU14235.1 MAG TPA: zinc-ribbon protein [Caudoviricetes sp.]MCC2832090.1 hypothetical protein [[Clostridium] innocuum]MCR0247016.1 hypothetical protein [[Clostridium] innocuum]MCR0258378.1 hypothetical protein [[Clostridium] innocuum]MCR0391076.1 hypothetical protein [[Clostridium] innocuum]
MRYTFNNLLKELHEHNIKLHMENDTFSPDTIVVTLQCGQCGLRFYYNLKLFDETEESILLDFLFVKVEELKKKIGGD